MLVELGVLPMQIVRAHDRRVAPGIAAAKPALLEHRDIGDAVVLREVIGRGEAMTAAADDEDVVVRLWRRLAPGRFPVTVAAQGMARQAEDRIPRHILKAALPQCFAAR